MAKLDAEVAEEFSDETSEERSLRKETEVTVTPALQKRVDELVDKLMLLTDELSGHPLREYQVPFARRIFESLVIGDGARITALFARQSGKTETVANVIAVAMIFLPRLAKVLPGFMNLWRFAEGVLVGAFAPVEDQADTLYGRIVARLSSDQAQKFYQDPEIDERVTGVGKITTLKKCGSSVRRMTCHPKAKIESKTYHIILVDECQDADSKTIRKSVSPMGASTRATHIWTGTPTYNKNIFYNQIQKNKRKALQRGRNKQNHFQADWKEVARCFPTYKQSVADEMESIGAESEEFRLSYNIEWLLDKGQFTTSEKFEQLGDKRVQALEHTWFRTPVVAGIDCGRKQDRTIVTIVWVDWDHPDEFGFYEHRVINWLDLEGMEWESQYFQIYEFLQGYKIDAVGVDIGGVGDVVINRLQTLMPNVNFVECGVSPGEQSVRYKWLQQLMQRRRMIWPMGAKVRKLKVFRRFRQEMEDAELEYKGQTISVAAPNEVDAHDDYVDSLCNAVAMTIPKQSDNKDDQVRVYDNFLFRPQRRGY